jgi:hypothetical protein
VPASTRLLLLLLATATLRAYPSTVMGNVNCVLSSPKHLHNKVHSDSLNSIVPEIQAVQDLQPDEKMGIAFYL